ncbi:MAG: foldase protein PrsA [Acidobacteriota bacterium]|jgi:parvulin-like peptidyl-prolyl isomerase|nr:foldase protein PrsA [Acidobacteriota bacterium]
MYLKNGRDALGLSESTEDGRRKIEQLREGIVSDLIDRTLIAQEAERRGLSIPSEKLSAAEQRAIEEFGGEQKYQAYLAENHLTRDEYLETIKLELYGALLSGDLNKGITVTDDDIRSYYEAHKNDPDLQQPERVTASHILINARPPAISEQFQSEKNLAGDALKVAVNAEMERRRKIAEELRRKAAAGADFAALARQSSEDPASRERGGELGTFTRNTHTRAFDDAAFALKPNTISDVVQTDYGFHVIKVSSHEPPRPMTLAEATPEIRNRLLTQRQAARLTDWLKEARRTATVRINEPFRFGALKTEFPSS